MLKTVNVYDLTPFLRVREQLHWMALAQSFLKLQKDLAKACLGREGRSLPGQLMLVWLGGDSFSSWGLSTSRDS